MRPSTAIIRQGVMKFTRRVDDDPRGRAFWLKVRLREHGDQGTRNLLMFDFCKSFAKNGITPEGGEFGGWDWQLLITNDEPGMDITEEVQEAVRSWFEGRDDVEIAEVSPIIDSGSAYMVLHEEWQKTEQLGAD
jgi:uncharacterized protein YggL (DUF469 family)